MFLLTAKIRKMGDKKKVLFFINSGMGGAERMTVYIAGCLDQKKYDVIFYVIGNDWGVVKQMLPEGYEQKLIKVKNFRDFLTFKMAKAIRTEKPDFAFSSVFPFNFRLCIASAFFSKVKIIVRSDNYLYTQTLIQRMRLFIGYRFLDYLIVQTDEMRDENIKQMWLKPSRVGTYANPVDTATIDKKVANGTDPLDHNVINYVFAGRIAHVKGLDILLQSFAEVLKVNSNSKLYILGDTTGVFEAFYNELLALSASLNIVDNVVFTGFNNNPYLYMKHADCFVLPSRNEGLPNVVIEALYLHTPVAVTTSVPVIERIVNNGVNGYLASVDNVTSLANAMLKCAELGRVESGYTSATKNDFEQLFVK